MYGDIFKQSSSYIVPPFETQNVPFLPYSDNLFTISAGYKIANDDNFGKPVNQAKIYNQNVAAGTKLQIPVYKTNYPPKSGETYAPIFQNKKASFPSYLSNLQNQLVLKPTVEDNRFNFGEAGTGEKVNAVQQLGSHFLLPSFQGQVIPISTLANNAPFPRYKGAAIQVYPTVAGFSTTAYQPLQAQQQFQFGHGIVQPVDNSGRPPSQAEEIRSDVEIIDEKKPRPPPRSDEDDGDQADDDDHGYTPPERHEANSQDDNDDYEVKSFKAPPAEGDFKPSTSFPFKEYDEKFGRYSNRDKLGGDEKSVSKNRDYSGDDDDESSARYLSEDTSSKAYYDRQEEEEGETYDDKPRDYERRKTKEERDENAAKYYDKNFDEEFDASYKAKLSKQKMKHGKGGRNIYEVEDPSSEGSQRNFRYYKDSRNTGGYSLVPETNIYEGGFGYKILGRRTIL
ncbi:hypothetical protein HZU67_07139 [Apis mellifera carnica]|nr:hypothetical protein HZU67_07139 [Apis mellifera carnica]